MVRHGEWRDAGCFLGSGTIESANKYVMQNRMKLPGTSWNLETARGMLSLKAALRADNSTRRSQLRGDSSRSARRASASLSPR